jgi:hypothetical protein
MGNPIDELLADHLKDLPPSEVAGWYLRLADLVEQQVKTVKEPLSPLFLRHYIKGGGEKLYFQPPEHLRNSKYVVDVLKDHRSWYLTEEKFKGKWVGIIPRLQSGKGKMPYPPTLHIQSLCEIDVKIIGSNTDGDNDLLTSFHGFQLESSIWVILKDIPRDGKKQVIFEDFVAYATDRYDFDENKHFRLPNPDFGNRFNVAKPVAADQKEIMVYHSNAIRMEKAGLAAPFDIASNGWFVTDLSIRGPGTIDPGKFLSPF